MKDDGELRKGRFLKKSSKLFDKVKVEPFSFADICKAKVTYPDNPLANILHQRLHRPEELNQTIKPTSKVFDNLVNPANQGPVIYPRDFTDDWLEEKRKAKRRNSSRYEDEDEFEMALEAEEEERRRQAEAARVREQRLAGDEPSKDKPEASSRPAMAKDSADATKGAEAQKQQLEQLQSPQKAPAGGAPHEVGEAIKKFAKPDPLSARAPTDLEASPPKRASSGEAGFAPLPEYAGTDHSAEAEDAGESAGAATPAAPALAPMIDPEILEQRQAEAYDAGYQEGLAAARQEAEAQAMAAARQELAATQGPLLQALDQGLKDISALKGDVLSRAQDNFYEITKALCESVLEQELQASPAAFQKVVNKVIAEVCQNDEYRVRLHPDDLHRLEQDKGASPLSKAWLSDERVPVGQFVIESGDQVVRSSVQKIVGSLLAEADLQLFSPQTQGEETPAAPVSAKAEDAAASTEGSTDPDKGGDGHEGT